FPLNQFVELIFLQIREFKIFKQQIQILVFGDLKDKVILPLTIRPGLAFTGTAGTGSPLGPLNAVTRAELIVTRMDDFSLPTSSLMERGLTYVAGRDSNTFSAFHVSDGAFIDGISNRVFDLLLVPA